MAAIRRADRAFFRARIAGLVSIVVGAWVALGSSVPSAQAIPIAVGRPAGAKCKTPGRWIPKLVSPANDADGNFVEDAIDALGPLDPVDVILACNRRPGAADRARFTASGGTLTYVGRTLSVAHLSGISAGDAVLLGADERVAFVFLDRELAPFLDTSLAAIRVTASSEYAGTNLEELVADLDGEGVTVAVVDTGIDAGHEVFEFTNFIGGADFSEDPPVYADPDDENGHGTHVAAIIAGGSSSGNRGVAPRANLFDVRVTDAGGNTTMSTVGQAIDVIVAQQDQLDVGVLFVGLGCDCDSAGDDPLSEAANRAVQAGIVVVAPMGNEGIQRVPAPATRTQAVAPKSACAPRTTHGSGPSTR